MVVGVYTGPTAAATSGEQADLGHQRLDGLDLRGLVLPYADLTACSARGQDLSHADLSGSLAIDSDFSGASFQSARLAGADFSRAELAAVGGPARRLEAAQGDLDAALLAAALHIENDEVGPDKSANNASPSSIVVQQGRHRGIFGAADTCVFLGPYWACCLSSGCWWARAAVH